MSYLGLWSKSYGNAFRVNRLIAVGGHDEVPWNYMFDGITESAQVDRSYLWLIVDSHETPLLFSIPSSFRTYIRQNLYFNHRLQQPYVILLRKRIYNMMNITVPNNVYFQWRPHDHKLCHVDMIRFIGRDGQRIQDKKISYPIETAHQLRMST